MYTEAGQERAEGFNPFVKFSREELIQQLEIARRHATEGKATDARLISDDIRKRYAR